MYRRALELNPNYAMAYYWYGFLLRIHLGRYEEALALQRKAAELDPLSAGIILEVGAALESLGRFDEALARYQRALEVDPGYADAYTSIGNHYWSVLGQLDEAVAWCAKGISLDPGIPRRSAWLGSLFLDLGDFDRAESWIERSLELGPENVWPNIVMHELHLFRGDEAAALDYARRVFALDPLFAPDLLRDHELRAGRYAEARALYEKIHRRSTIVTGGQQSTSFWSYPKPASGNTQIYCSIAASSTSKRFRASVSLAMASLTCRSTHCGVRNRKRWRPFGKLLTTAGALFGGMTSNTTRIWNPSTTNPNFRRWSPRSKPTWQSS